MRKIKAKLLFFFYTEVSKQASWTKSKSEQPLDQGIHPVLSLVSSKRAAQEVYVTGSAPSGVTASPRSRQTAALQEDTDVQEPVRVFNSELFYYCSTMGLFLVIMKSQCHGRSTDNWACCFQRVM